MRPVCQSARLTTSHPPFTLRLRLDVVVGRRVGRVYPYQHRDDNAVGNWTSIVVKLRPNNNTTSSYSSCW